MVQLIREIILPHSSHVPKDFVLKIVALLNKGSIHSATSSTPVGMCFSQTTAVFAIICNDLCICFVCLFSLWPSQGLHGRQSIYRETLVYRSLVSFFLNFYFECCWFPNTYLQGLKHSKPKSSKVNSKALLDLTSGGKYG